MSELWTWCSNLGHTTLVCKANIVFRTNILLWTHKTYFSKKAIFRIVLLIPPYKIFLNNPLLLWTLTNWPLTHGTWKKDCLQIIPLVYEFAINYDSTRQPKPNWKLMQRWNVWKPVPRPESRKRTHFRTFTNSEIFFVQ